MKFVNRRDLISVMALGLLPTGPAMAQSLLDKAKGALGGLTGKSSAGSSAGGSTTGGDLGSGLSIEEIGGGLKDALRIATDRTVSAVGRADGYWGDPAIRIPLPASLQKIDQALKLAGYDRLTRDLQVRINRAAEAAAPQARDVFVESISQMTVDDARGILNGPDTAATQYFERTMTDPLKTRMRPIVDQQLSQVGAVKSLESVRAQAKRIPGAPSVSTGLTDFTLEGALSGLFHYLGEEEKAIRHNPASRTTDLLKKVFG